MNRLFSVGIFPGILIFVCAGTASATSGITFTDLGTLLYDDGYTYGYSSSGKTINASGQVAGTGNYSGAGMPHPPGKPLL